MRTWDEIWKERLREQKKLVILTQKQRALRQAEEAARQAVDTLTDELLKAARPNWTKLN